ncbi:MAG: metallophosphoesterase [Candidatus Aminicenantes bacterium]|nr:metallophosphoesterase [Candidatus Aminicenantes bacterium]
MNPKLSRREFLNSLPLALVNGAFFFKKPGQEIFNLPFFEPVQAQPSSFNKDRIEEIRNFCNLYGTPYNSQLFEAGERIIFKGTEPYLSLVTKENVVIPSLTIRLSDGEVSLNRKEKKLFNLSGAVEIPLGDCFQWKPKILKYKLIYRTLDNRTEETCYRYFKTPLRTLRYGPIRIIVLSDTHLPDDRGFTRQDLNNPELFDLRTNGEYVNRIFLTKLVNNSAYLPTGDERYLLNGFNIARLMWHILNNEDPDFIINLGDDHGGFGHTWESLGLPNQHLATDWQLDSILKMFRLAQRKIYSSLMGHIPYYYVLGNHDGENGWSRKMEYAKKWRKTYLPLPGADHKSSPDENYYQIIWGYSDNFMSFTPKPPDLTCLILDCTRYNLTQPRIPEDWKVGVEQRQWLEERLNEDCLFRFVFSHHVFGGWPTQSSCQIDGPHEYAYGRGPGFTREYYEELNKFLELNGGSHLKVNPDKIEQVHLTNLFLKKGVDAVIYGHDHAFRGRKIGRCANGREMSALCAGSTKNLAEISWFRQPLFIKDYGYYEKREFFTSPGYLLIEVKDSGIGFYYKVASSLSLAINSNIPFTAKVGDVLSAYLI